MEEEINSRYIQQISPKMFHVESYTNRDGMDIDEFGKAIDDLRFLKLFLELCLERWDLTSTSTSDEILKYIPICYQVIWLEDQDHNGRTFLDRVMKPIPEEREVEDLRSLIFDLEGRIHQTKLLIEGWCLSLLPNSSIQMQSKPTSSTIDEVQKFLTLVKKDNLSVLLRRDAGGIVPFENYIDTLIDMTGFLLDLLNDLLDYSTESKNFIEFLNFVSVFSNKAACFTCLSWAKQVSVDQIATSTEMNILLFAMIHEFMPSAPDVIAWFFRILRSTNETLHSVLLQQTVQNIVGFFFGHLETTLVDEFPILWDRLIYLLTFMIDNHPSENAKEEDLIIRSQIYALFREDVYPLLSFNEIKEDFYNNNIILRDFINKVEIANATIRQRYYAFSYSWIGSEAVKIDYFYFVLLKSPLIKHIWSRSWSHRSWSQPIWNQLQLYVMELEFLRASLLWFVTDGDEEIRSRLNHVIISLQGIWGKEEKEKGFLAVRLHEALNDKRGKIADWHVFTFAFQTKIELPKPEIVDIVEGNIVNWHVHEKILPEGKKRIAEWHLLAFELQEKIELSKLQISTHLLNGFHWSLGNKPSTSNKVLKFLESILHNLNDLVRYKASKILPFKKQIETLQDKLAFMQNMMKLVNNCTDSKDLSEFIMFARVFANEAAHLTILYWLKEANDETATEINLKHSHMLQKISPVTSDVARLYFETLKTIYLQRSDPLLFGRTASIFVDFLLEDSVTLFKDDFEVFRDEIIFLLTFLNDPTSGNDEELFCNQVDNTFWEDVYGILPIDDMKMVRLSGFMMKIKALNAKIQKRYCEFPDSSLYDLPKITSPWYLDFLIQNLRSLKERMITDRKLVPFVKYKTKNIEQELVSLSPLFNCIFELENELNDTWLQVVDVVHLAERVINSCISSCFVFDHPIWYYMSYLSYVFDQIKYVKEKLEKVKEKNMHNVCCLPHATVVVGTHSNLDWSSKINEVVVGFEDETKKLIEDLTRGHKSLDIVSIVGMGGLGKTTLARKVSSLVEDHFHILAFCTVSQDHNTRMLLLGILKFIIKVDDEIHRMTTDDLAHKLWKCLSRQKYLIVLDDIWHTSVWNEIKRSLPDNENGSRVMFTTRFYDVANDCKMKCSPFEMPFMSDAKSWELLQKKVFQNGISPPNLSKVGRQIAESCKGLPLAIVVIAGVLVRKERSKSSWTEIAEKLFYFLSDEGCMKILELSYNHLPEYLKPCILYLGAFPEDKLFRVNQVIQLWIAEGFVHEYEAKSVEDVAKEYFHDLVNRSLMIVSSRGSNGEIKTFNIHDLIHKLCQTKCHEGNFFKLGRGIAASGSIYNQYYRISDLAVPQTISGGSSLLENASTVVFTDKAHQDSPFKKLKLVQVLYFDTKGHESDMTVLTSLVNLRHIEYNAFIQACLPSSISNIWNIQSLILTCAISVPETIWRMKSLRHVKVGECMIQYSDDQEKLDKVISFSRPVVYSGKDIECLLQRLPVVRKLGIQLRFPYNVDTLDIDDVDTLDFFRKLESLNISNKYLYTSLDKPYLINFPSTLKKLTLEGVYLSLTCISSIVELKCLRVLKLRRNSFRGPTMEMEDVVFSHLVFFELFDDDLEQWNASTESFPCLEQLLIRCRKLEELPPCFGEISTLNSIAISYSSTGVGASALRIRDEHMDLGIKVEVTINDKKVI